jgi:aspartate racemase
MKRIGILGGTSPESTVIYYRYVTREYVRRFGDHGYPEIVLFSVSFQRYIDWMKAEDWEALAAGVLVGLEALGRAGAEIGILATNTFHRIFEEVAATAPFPLLSILDVVARRLLELGCTRPALLGTRLTMSGSFYPDRLQRDGIAVVVPTSCDQASVDRVIFDELSSGTCSAESKEALLGIARRLVEQGADAVVLGCTELPLLIEEEDLPVPVLDTTRLHAAALLEAALA